MITELTVSNYRSLGRNVRISPGRLAVLVGPNGSGKSNLLDVLTFVRDIVVQGLPAAVTHRGGIDSVRRRSTGHPYNVDVRIQLSIDDAVGSYAFTIVGDRHEEYRVKAESGEFVVDGERHWFRRDGDDWQGPDGIHPRMDPQSLAITALAGTAQFKPMADYLSRMTVYTIFPDTLRRPQKFDPVVPMERHGENWVSILRELNRSDARADLIAGIRKLTGDVEDIKIAQAAGLLVTQFKQVTRGGTARWFDADQQSDGTLRIAGLITALLQEPSLPTIGIEEPELTVHPGVLPMVFDYVRQATERSQVLVTTHSPVLLDEVDLQHDRVFVVRRVNGETVVRAADEAMLQPVRDDLMSLGDLLLAGELQLELELESTTPPGA